MYILLAGGAEFVGLHAGKAPLARGHSITTLDELNAYCDTAVKCGRLAEVAETANYCFFQSVIVQPGAQDQVAGAERYDLIVYLVAQAGARYAVTDPGAYSSHS